MTERNLCPTCREPAEGPGAIPCYICGRAFHFTRDRECGSVAPQTIGC